MKHYEVSGALWRWVWKRELSSVWFATMMVSSKRSKSTAKRDRLSAPFPSWGNIFFPSGISLFGKLNSAHFYPFLRKKVADREYLILRANKTPQKEIVLSGRSEVCRCGSKVIIGDVDLTMEFESEEKAKLFRQFVDFRFTFGPSTCPAMLHLVTKAAVFLTGGRRCQARTNTSNFTATCPSSRTWCKITSERGPTRRQWCRTLSTSRTR